MATTVITRGLLRDLAADLGNGFMAWQHAGAAPDFDSCEYF